MPDTTSAEERKYRRVLGRNISAERGRLQKSQTAIAARMQKLQFTDWRQQTVASVEKGMRRLSAEELFGLVLALETTVPRLLTPPGGTLFVELPSDSGQFLPSRELWKLAEGAKGGTVTVKWFAGKNGDIPIRAVIGPDEIPDQGSWSSEELPDEQDGGD